MKKLLIYLMILSMCIHAGFVYAEDNADWRDTDKIKVLLDRCDAEGINTEYEKVNYNILDRFVTYYAEDEADGASEQRLSYNNSVLTDMYNETIENLTSYLDGSKAPKSKATEYKTNGYNIGSGNLVNNDGEPFFSNGYGHFDEVRDDIKNLSKFGANNVQIEEGTKYYIEKNDGIPAWKYSGNTDGTIEVDKTNGYNSQSCLKITNKTAKTANVYMTVYQDVFLEPNTTYEYGFYIKGSNINDAWVSAENWDSRKQISGNFADWTLKRYYFANKTSYGTTIRITSEGITDEMLIDGFYIKKVGTNENLLKNSGFEETSDEFFEAYSCNTRSIALRAYLKQAEENNIAVCLNLAPHYFPDFVKELYPEISGGYGLMSFNVDHTAVKKVLSAYAAAVMEAVGDSPAVTGICITNEPTFSTVRNQPYFNNYFREYLKNRYSTVETLNSKYKTSYSGFSDISIPNDYRQTPLFYDWMNFNEKFFSDWHEWFKGEIKKYNAEMPVYTKMMASMMSNEASVMERGSDYALFSEWGDMMGFDAGGGISDFANLDMMTSITNKPLYNSENHVISNKDDVYDETRARSIYYQLWQEALHGLDASTIWVWSRTTDTSSDLYGSILNRPDCLRAVANVGLDLNRNMKIITAFQEKKKDAVILYSEASNLYNTSYKSDMLDIYKKLLYSGVRCGFVNEEKIDLLAGYDTLIVNADYVEDKTYDAVMNFAKNGGKVIFTSNNALKYDEFKTSRTVDKTNVITADKNSIINYISDKIKYTAYENGQKADKVAIETLEYDGKEYLSISNFDDSNTYLILPNKKYYSYYNLVDEETQGGIVELKPLESKLLRIDGIVDAEQYSLVNPVAGTGNSGELLLSWINPDSENITKMDILDANGNSIIGDTALNTNSRAVNSFNVTGLTNGREYAYSVVYTVEGVEKAAEIRGMPQSLDVQWNTQNGYSFDGKWKLAGQGDKARVDSKIYAYVDATEAHSGKSSMKIVSNYDKTAYARFIDANGIWGLDKSKTYTLSLWAKTENLGIASSDFHGERDAIQLIHDWEDLTTLGHSGEGWQQYTATLSGRTWIMPGLFISTQGTVWVDDVELYANDDESKTNLITYGDFEYSDTGITREMATAGNTSVLISWKNPSGGKILGIDILDENGEKVAVSNTPSITNGEFANANITGLVSGRNYTYTISINMMNGPLLQKTVSALTGINYQYDTQNGVKLYDLAKIRIEQGSGVLPFNVEINKEAAHSGKYGLHAVSNYTNWVNLKFNPITLDNTKKYRASVWAKAENVSREIWLCSDNTGKTMIDNSGEWKKYSFDISNTNSFIMNLQSAMTTFTDLCADDFAVYELDENGAEIGNNLLKNGDFEDIFGAKVSGSEKYPQSVTVDFTAYNYLINKTLTPSIILAVYDADNKLIDTAYDTFSVSTSMTETKKLAIPYKEEYNVRAFMWDGQTMVPIGDAENIN